MTLKLAALFSVLFLVGAPVSGAPLAPTSGQVRVPPVTLSATGYSRGIETGLTATGYTGRGIETGLRATGYARAITTTLTAVGRPLAPNLIP